MSFDPRSLIVPGRKITGISAILLPFTDTGSIDWLGFERHVEHTARAGLIPAINMDTGFGNLLTLTERLEALERTRSVLGRGEFVAGAFVPDQPGASYDEAGYLRSIEPIHANGGTPVIVQSHGLTSQPGPEIVRAYEGLGAKVGNFIAFELGKMFAPFGSIYSLDVFEGLLGVKACLGAKHSSLSRDQEWQRLILRNKIRPDFKVFTGNDLAIDMVMYGSDYLLGLSTFDPEAFAKRDTYWANNDPAFYELNDKLQYLGAFAFREPVPAYKHSAAMYLKIQGQLASDATHPRSATRPDSDRAILETMWETF
jgi:dihydrodipicolinate synthase/N-acetylneuraminate lyase